MKIIYTILYFYGIIVFLVKNNFEHKLSKI